MRAISIFYLIIVIMILLITFGSQFNDAIIIWKVKKKIKKIILLKLLLWVSPPFFVTSTVFGYRIRVIRIIIQLRVSFQSSQSFSIHHSGKESRSISPQVGQLLNRSQKAGANQEDGKSGQSNEMLGHLLPSMRSLWLPRLDWLYPHIWNWFSNYFIILNPIFCFQQQKYDTFHGLNPSRTNFFCHMISDTSIS